MAMENGKEPKAGSKAMDDCETKMYGVLVVFLRLLSLLATSAASVGMGLNKQTKTSVVAMVGTTPIFQTLTAQFQQNPSYVYFVLANGAASLYNLLVVIMRPFLSGHNANHISFHLFDMVIKLLVTTGATAAASMAQVAKNGNSHARWNPICDKFDAFCCRGALALIASFVGALLMLLINGLHFVHLHRRVAAKN